MKNYLFSTCILLVALIHQTNGCVKTICGRKTAKGLSPQDQYELIHDYYKTEAVKMILETSIYKGQSVKGLLKQCSEAPIAEKLTQKPNEDELNEEKLNVILNEKSECQIGLEGEKAVELTNGQHINLLEAQSQLQLQLDFYQCKFFIVLDILIFVIPFCLMVYLIIKGHFYVGHLPILMKYFKEKPDPTAGLKYNLYLWMKYLILSGDHPQLRGKDPFKTAWYKYNKEDEKIDEEEMKCSNVSRFKFAEKSKFSCHVTEDEYNAHSHKSHKISLGWNFLTEAKFGKDYTRLHLHHRHDSTRDSKSTVASQPSATIKASQSVVH